MTILVGIVALYYVVLITESHNSDKHSHNFLTMLLLVYNFNLHEM